MTDELKLGLDTFGDVVVRADGSTAPYDEVLRNVVEQGVLADQVGVDAFGVGEHHRDDYAVSAPDLVLAAIGARTERIVVGSAVTVGVDVAPAAPATATGVAASRPAAPSVGAGVVIPALAVPAADGSSRPKGRTPNPHSAPKSISRLAEMAAPIRNGRGAPVASAAPTVGLEGGGPAGAPVGAGATIWVLSGRCAGSLAINAATCAASARPSSPGRSNAGTSACTC